MQKKKLKLKQSAKITIAGSILILAMIMLLIKCIIEVLGHHYIALYFGVGCAAFFAMYFVIVIIDDTLNEQKKTYKPQKCFKSSKFKIKKFTV